MRQQDKTSGNSPLTEHDIIARYFRPLAEGVPGAYGLADDAASLSLDGGEDLVVTTDALVADVHFFANDAPEDVAWKALAVNVSDLAAKAAMPLAYSLALVLPRNIDESWIAGFAKGLAVAQQAFGIGLSGGDTAASHQGPLTISITAFGTVPRSGLVRRNTAKAGDALYVSGTIGDAALGLKLRGGDAEALSWPLDNAKRQFLTARYLRPEPRIGLRDALLAYASAAMDVSDGLAIDASRLCAASAVRICINASALPFSAPARKLTSAGAVSLAALISGGDDYEILSAIPPKFEQSFLADAASLGVPITRIGHCADGAGLEILDAAGATLALDRLGYDHFRS